MVSTRSSDVEPRTRGRMGWKPEEAPDDAVPRSGRPRPIPVKARVASRRIGAAADASDVLEVRGRLRTLARQVARRPDNVRSVTRIETEISECLDEAAARTTTSRERWLLDEAAAWAVAWLAGARRAGVSSGSLLERLLREADRADERLAAGDVASARFLLVLARLFRDVDVCRRHDARVVAALAGDIARLVAPSGAVASAGSAAILERVAHWSECREVGLATGGLPWDDHTERQWAATVGVAVRLLGGRGRILAGSGQLPAVASAALVQAVGAAGRRAGSGQRFAKPLRRAVRLLERQGQRARADERGRLPPPDFHDADAGLTIIRSAWSEGGAAAGLRVLLDHREATPWLEIAVADRLLMAGPWRFRVWVGGREREPQGPWTVAAWESDRAVSFVEISAPLGDGIRFDRHLVVLPRQGVVLAADAVVARGPDGHSPGHADGVAHVGNGAPRSDGIDYVGTLPLAAALEAEPAADTRDIVLYDTTTRGMALPLGLNEWRAGGGGSFEATGAGLSLTQSGHGRLYAPVWIDLEAAHVGGPLTWRQLTVADSRAILPAWQAVGYRVQAGDEQWLVYRALDVVRNRTVLGCNVACEFLVGRVRPRGLVSRTLEIS
jgi:hypothetical protein